jgi:hypothetical protein
MELSKHVTDQEPEQEVPQPGSEMLELPYTFPDTGFAYQMLSVVEDMYDDCKMHVEYADAMDYAESWGAYLAEVARVIARDHADHLLTNRSDGDLFTAIINCFFEAVTPPSFISWDDDDQATERQQAAMTEAK